MTGLDKMILRFVVRLALAFVVLWGTAPPGSAQSFGANSALVRIQNAARALADPANNDRVVIQSGTNRQLAAVIADNNRRSAENRLAALVIGAISRNPGLTNAYMPTIAAAAPALAPGVKRRVQQAYPYRMISLTAGPATAGAAPRIILRNPAHRSVASPPPPARPAGGDVNFDELAEADAEDDAGSSDRKDPFETVNRMIFAVNDTLDTYIFRPIAWTYGWIMPEFAKRSINNAFRNLKSPAIFGNDLLQGEIGDAGVTFLRFLINSTVGVAGLFDIAEEFDLEHHDADFGQTLHGYNIGAGPYIMIPFLGPASARDGVGKLVDAFMDPITYLLTPPDRTLFGLGKALVSREKLIEQLDDLRKTSVDYYAAIRSLYYQDRARILRRGRPPAGADFEEVSKAGE